MKSYYTPISITNSNEDDFIHRGYGGGHADVYTPYGEDLHYFYVNSLYPSVMRESPLPIGQAKWHGDLVEIPSSKPKRVMYRISNGAFAGCAAVILLPNRCQIRQISYGFQDEVLMRYAFC